jgi:hypothetical protein
MVLSQILNFDFFFTQKKCEITAQNQSKRKKIYGKESYHLALLPGSLRNMVFHKWIGRCKYSHTTPNKFVIIEPLDIIIARRMIKHNKTQPQTPP